MALPLAYFCVGFAITFIDTPVKVRLLVPHDVDDYMVHGW